MKEVLIRTKEFVGENKDELAIVMGVTACYIAGYIMGRKDSRIFVNASQTHAKDGVLIKETVTSIIK